MSSWANCNEIPAGNISYLHNNNDVVSKFNFKWANSIQKKLLSYALWVTLPYTVKDFSIWKYPDIDVRNDDFMLSSFLFITKEGIWHPHFSWIC